MCYGVYSIARLPTPATNTPGLYVRDARTHPHIEADEPEHRGGRSGPSRPFGWRVWSRNNTRHTHTQHVLPDSQKHATEGPIARVYKRTVLDAGEAVFLRLLARHRRPSTWQQ